MCFIPLFCYEEIMCYALRLSSPRALYWEDIMRGDGLRIGSGRLRFCHVCHVLQSSTASIFGTTCATLSHHLQGQCSSVSCIKASYTTIHCRNFFHKMVPFVPIYCSEALRASHTVTRLNGLFTLCAINLLSFLTIRSLQ